VRQKKGGPCERRGANLKALKALAEKAKRKAKKGAQR